MPDDSRMSFWIFVFTLGCYLATSGGHFYVSDEVVMYRLTESIVTKHDIAVEILPGEDWGSDATVAGNSGKRYPVSGLGQSVACAPLFAAGRALSGVCNKTNAGFEKTGVLLFNQIICAMICASIFLILRRLRYPVNPSVAAALSAGFCTFLWPYSKYFLNLPLTALFLLASFFTLIPYGDNRKNNMMLAGLFLSFAVIVRTETVIFFAVFLIYIFLKEKQDNIRKIIQFSLSACTALPVVMWYNAARTGNYLNLGYPKGGFSNSIPAGLWGLILSPGKSIFLYSPLLLLSLFFLPRFYKRNKAEAVFIMLVLAVSSLFYSAWFNWQGGRSWGPRFMLPATVFISMFSVEFFKEKEWSRPFRFFSSGILAAGVFVQIIAVLVDNVNALFALETAGLDMGEVFGYGIGVPPLFIQWSLIKKIFAQHAWDKIDILLIRNFSTSAWLFLTAALCFTVGLVKILDITKRKNQI